MRSVRLARGLVWAIAAGALASCAGAPRDRPAPAPRSGPPPAPPAALGRPGPGRLPRLVTPVGYDLRLRVDPRQERFSGEVAIRVRVAFPTDRVNLHAVEMELSRVEAVAGGRTIAGKLESATGKGADPDWGEKVLVLDEPLAVGEAELRLVWQRAFDPRLAGLYRARSGEDWYAYTQFEAADARKAFPCFDEPAFKTPFRVTLKVPEGMGAFANTPEEARETRDGWTTLRFAETRPLPTYLVALAVGPLDVVPHPGASAPLRGLAARGRGAMLGPALAMHASLLRIEEEWFGIPYPYEKLDVAALVEFTAGAMENAGLITYREEALLIDPATTPKSRVRGVAGTAAHELAHQWFGNLVTMPWWDDLWLNEAFATWMGHKTLDLYRPEWRAGVQLLQGRNWVLSQDALAAARAVRQPVATVAEAEQAFDGITYVKGANVLGMIERWIGEDAFRKGVRAYLDKHAWGSATAADLLSALDLASGKEAGAVARSFLDRPGVPLVEAALSCEGHVPEVVLSQSRFRPMGGHAEPGFPEGGPWRVPVCVLYPGTGALRRECTLLSATRASMRLSYADACPQWFHPNAGESGYYRWAIPADSLRALVRNAPDELDLPSRVSLPDQVWSMVESGRLDAGAWLDVAAAMKDERDREAVEQVVVAVERVAGVWEDLAETPAYRRFADRMLAAHGRRLGLRPRKGEDEDVTLLRPQVMAALGRRARDRGALAEALALARRWLRDARSVPADLAPAALALAAREGKVTFEELRAALAAARTPAERLNALAALAALPAGEPIGRALALMLTDEVRAQDLRYLLFAPFGRPETRDQAMAFLHDHYDAVWAKLPSFVGAMHLPRLVGAFCDPEKRSRARGFFEGKKIKGGERALAEGVEQADRCIALRAAGREAVAAWLERSR